MWSHLYVENSVPFSGIDNNRVTFTLRVFNVFKSKGPAGFTLSACSLMYITHQSLWIGFDYGFIWNERMSYLRWERTYNYKAPVFNSFEFIWVSMVHSMK